MAIFDSKVFNSEVFSKYVGTISDLKRNELLKSGALNVRNDLRATLSDQVGGNYIVVPMKAPISGATVNYDGSTDITAEGRKTYSQGMVVVGRAVGFVEKDFSSDVTGGEDFLPLAREIAHYWDNVDQDTILAVLKGIFSMTGTKNAEFVTKHTTDISAEAQPTVGATTLNSAIQKASGDNKNAFALVVMHSAVSTNLENLSVLNYLKYTDANGIERDLGLATWNGRIVLIDDNMPVEGDGADAKYTTYVLGKGAFEYCDCGAKVPFEMDRNPAKNGGETTLYSRQRKLIAPKGISFKKPVTTSPTDEELASGASWEIAQATDGSGAYPHKGIPIARIISKG